MLANASVKLLANASVAASTLYFSTFKGVVAISDETGYSGMESPVNFDFGYGGLREDYSYDFKNSKRF